MTTNHIEREWVEVKKTAKRQDIQEYLDAESYRQFRLTLPKSGKNMYLVLQDINELLNPKTK